jgi:hypothetical protein
MGRTRHRPADFQSPGFKIHHRRAGGNRPVRDDATILPQAAPERGNEEFMVLVLHFDVEERFR